MYVSGQFACFIVCADRYILSVVNLSFAQLNYHCYSSFHFPIVCMMLHKTYYCYYNFQFCLIWPIFQSTLEAMTGPQWFSFIHGYTL